MILNRFITQYFDTLYTVMRWQNGKAKQKSIIIYHGYEQRAAWATHYVLMDAVDRDFDVVYLF